MADCYTLIMFGLETS